MFLLLHISRTLAAVSKGDCQSSDYGLSRYRQRRKGCFCLEDLEQVHVQTFLSVAVNCGG